MRPRAFMRLATVCLGALPWLPACGGGAAAPPPPPTATVAEASASATQTPTATLTSVASPSTPRGVQVVEASDGTEMSHQIPDGPLAGPAPAMPAQYSVPAPDEVRVETFVTGLEVPWSLAFAPGGRLFVSERPGRIRIVQDGVLDPAPWATLAVRAEGEGGLMGLTLDPAFAQTGWVYVCYSFDDSGQMRNRISRIHETDGRGAGEEVLLDRLPGANIHNGCRLKFGPDGNLYATTGDATARDLAQDPGALNGKILRLHADGTIPEDNPFGPSSPVYSYGHRNPQGLAFHPRTGQLFETEHGPSGEVSVGAYDEVNIIVAGANYGWPAVIGAPHLPQYRDPLLCYPNEAVPPTGATFYSATLIPQWTGNLLFTTLASRHLQRVVFDDSGKVTAIERLFTGVYGRLRDIVEGPDGALYMSTSNRDGRGSPSADDDRVLRLVPSH